MIKCMLFEKAKCVDDAITCLQRATKVKLVHKMYTGIWQELSAEKFWILFIFNKA